MSEPSGLRILAIFHLTLAAFVWGFSFNFLRHMPQEAAQFAKTSLELAHSYIGITVAEFLAGAIIGFWALSEARDCWRASEPNRDR